MISITKIDDKNIQIQFGNGDTVVSAAIYYAKVFGNSVNIYYRDSDRPVPNLSSIAISDLEVDGIAYTDAAELAKALNAFIGSFKSGGSSPSPTQSKTVEITENGTTEVVPDEGYNLSKVTVEVEVQGGGENGAGDVRFIDYDGTIIVSYSLGEAQALTKLPTHPEHDLLTGDGWTHTLEQVNTATRKLDVGAQYKTTDGNTHVFGTVTLASGYAVPFCFQIVGTATFRFDWHDGTYTDVSASQNGLIHAFVDGDYHVTIERISGTGTIILGGKTPSTIFVGQNTLSYKQTVRSIFVGDFTGIDTYSFYNCTSLVSIVIPKGINIVIGVNIFGECQSLVCVVIPSGVTSIENSAFNNCRALRNAVIPPGVAIIDIGGLQNCWPLASIVIPDSVTILGASSFSGSYSITSFFIPSSITSIGANAFANNPALKYIEFESEIPPTFGMNVFSGTTSIFKIYVPDSSVELYKTATNIVAYANRIYPTSQKPAE